MSYHLDNCHRCLPGLPQLRINPRRRTLQLRVSLHPSARFSKLGLPGEYRDNGEPPSLADVILEALGGGSDMRLEWKFKNVRGTLQPVRGNSGGPPRLVVSVQEPPRMYR
jgi:hypothetical protein